MKGEKEKQFGAYITVRCSEAIHADLAILAKDDKRSISNYIRMVLERHVESAKAVTEEAEDRAA